MEIKNATEKSFCGIDDAKEYKRMASFLKMQKNTIGKPSPGIKVNYVNEHKKKHLKKIHSKYFGLKLKRKKSRNSYSQKQREYMHQYIQLKSMYTNKAAFEKKRMLLKEKLLRQNK